MKYLVTGASGFIGGFLVERLVKEGHTVKSFVRKTSKIEHIKKLNTQICYGDLLDKSSLEKSMKDVGKVFHCAAFVSDWGKKEDFYNTNVMGTKNILEIAYNHRVEKFIAITTTDVYGYPGKKNVNEQHPLVMGKNFYSETKIKAEELLWDFYKEKSFPIVIIRPATVYGPRSYSIVKEAINIIKSGFVPYINRGEVIAGLCYIDNLIDAICLSAENERAAGNAYNITDGSNITWKDFLNSLIVLSEKKPIKFSLPIHIAFKIGTLMEFFARITKTNKRPMLTKLAVELLGKHQSFDISKAQKELGYNPKIDFKTGMQKTEKWLREEGYLKS